MYSGGFDDEYNELAKDFFIKFNSSVPLYVVPATETLYGIKKTLKRSLRDERNIFSETYNVNPLLDY
jgi:hypothetical protein